jgi:7-cyano-7-deazaguanine synthase in queuosine biosynthesis
MSLVLWSGGCDSTLVLWDLLQDQSPKSPAINTIAINYPQIMGAEMAKAKRKAILNELRGRGFRINHGEVIVAHDGATGIQNSYGLPQAALWVSLSPLYLGEKEDLYAGYVRGDDACHHKEALKGVFGWQQNLLGKTGNLLWPLEWTHKSEVIARLKAAKLLNLVWWCEQMTKDGSNCGKCSSCITHALALKRLVMETKKKASA